MSYFTVIYLPCFPIPCLHFATHPNRRKKSGIGGRLPFCIAIAEGKHPRYWDHSSPFPNIFEEMEINDFRDCLSARELAVLVNLYSKWYWQCLWMNIRNDQRVYGFICASQQALSEGSNIALLLLDFFWTLLCTFLENIVRDKSYTGKLGYTVLIPKILMVTPMSSLERGCKALKN